MKVKADFVTNSSSSAYVVSLREAEISEFLDYLEEMNQNSDYCNEGLRIWERFHNKKELMEYATGRPYDWASKPFSPQIENMDERTFKACLDAINEGCVALYVAVDYNACEDFERSTKYGDRMEHCPL